MKNLFFLLLIYLSSSIVELLGHSVPDPFIQEDIPYERFISLGNCCVSRSQINSHLTQRFARDSKSFGGGQLFDWVIIHDYDKLAETIENNLVDFFERSDLVLYIGWEGPSCPYVKNVKNNITWRHLFTRRGDGSIAENFLDLEYEIKKKKVDYLAEKFRLLKNYRTLYVIAYPFIGAGILETIEPSKKSLIRLYRALSKLRGNSNFKILFCQLEPKFKELEKIRVRKIVSSHPFFLGDHESWHRVLSEFPYTLDKLEFDNSELDNTWGW